MEGDVSVTHSPLCLLTAGSVGRDRHVKTSPVSLSRKEKVRQEEVRKGERRKEKNREVELSKVMRIEEFKYFRLPMLHPLNARST
jgi:hypothetical protein